MNHLSAAFVSICVLLASGGVAQRICVKRGSSMSSALPPVVRNGSAFPILGPEFCGCAPEAAEPQPFSTLSERQSHSAQEKAKPRHWALNQSSKQSPAQPINITVALDGTGQFKSVQEAIMSVPAGSADKPVVIRIRPGKYKELIYIQHEKRFFRLVGEDATKTVLTFDLNANLIGPDHKPITTFRTPSTVIDADDFMAENITFENSAGPVGQALAIRVDGDRAVFRNCRFLGWQDTLFLNRGRQYFEGCYIAGHVDFIFGAATAFFEHCHIHCLRNGYITAASTYDYYPYGFVFSNCKITGEPDAKTYLGRPWRDSANTIYLNTEMSDVVRPEGWQNWNLPAREKTARYAEFNSKGPGANPRARVAWSKQLSSSQSKRITVRAVLSGSDQWDPRSVRMTAEPKP